ncbi:tyrosine-type recombinase/integrase [Butyricicoccus sp. OF27-2pH9A]|uniref:tyrosine-type recombinase/integrase n=1 Tax=Butyricicoccus sp. OF27-2pH9A TaxID=3002517 RepID=UPI003FA406C8
MFCRLGFGAFCGIGYCGRQSVRQDIRPPLPCSGGFSGKYGLPEIRFHGLRHTAGSLLLAQGVNIKQIQEFLGHSDVTTTLNIYTPMRKRKRKRRRLWERC